MNYILFDFPEGKHQTEFIARLLGEDTIECYSPKKENKLFSIILSAYSISKRSTKRDTIICWYDFQAILCYWLCKFTFRRRKIVCINLLLKDKETLKNRLVSWLYKKALNSKHFIASVTSKEYGEHIKKRLGIKKDFYLLHDVYHDSYIYDKQVEVKPNTVFCGGRNGRDWHFMVEVAKVMPMVEFHLVMPKSTYEELQSDLPSNVIAKYNLTLDEFMREMCASEIVALPLDTEAPAGLIVLFQAAANMKPIITTDTMTTREYLSFGRGSLKPNVVDDWVAELKSKLGSDDLNKKSSSKMLNFLQSECSETIFVDVINHMISDIK